VQNGEPSPFIAAINAATLVDEDAHLGELTVFPDTPPYKIGYAWYVWPDASPLIVITTPPSVASVIFAADADAVVVIAIAMTIAADNAKLMSFFIFFMFCLPFCVEFFMSFVFYATEIPWRIDPSLPSH
jgi:hypothetical protein